MGSTQGDIQVSYDVSNEFFRLWLDERMNYTCAVFEGTDSLEAAQLKKLAVLHDYAHLGPHTRRVLDIGCGWGANVEYLAVDRRIREVHGITLSPAQHAEIMQRKLPNVRAECVSYLDYKPEAKFDALVSICMMEHICTPEEARAGKAVDMYRNYFRLAHEWTEPGSWFGLQTILRNRFPRNKKEIQDIGHATYVIFPGGITPRLEDVIMAVNPHWEIMEIKTRREHYKKTTEHWHQRLVDHKAEIVKRWGQTVFDDYDRYLTTCINAFEKHYQSLAQYSLRRID